MVEVQARSGLPHKHRLAWQQLAPTCRRLLTLLQAGTSSTLSLADLRPVVEMGARALTVSTSPAHLQEQYPLLTAHQAEEVARLMVALQTHHHTPSCTTEFPAGQECREFFPRLPSLLNLVARQPDLQNEEQVERLGEYEGLHWKVQRVLRARLARGQVGEEEEQVGEVELLLRVLRETGPAPQALPQGSFTWQGSTFPLGQELDLVEQEVIQSSGVPLEAVDLTLLTLYHASRLEKPLTRLILIL